MNLEKVLENTWLMFCLFFLFVFFLPLFHFISFEYHGRLSIIKSSRNMYNRASDWSCVLKRHVHYIKELNKSLPEQKKIPTKLRDFLRFCGVSVKQGERLNVLTNFSENLAMLSASAAKKLCVICD